MSYLPHIDGLRVLAITLVALYHTGISLFRNYYIGVDLFFVLSGYVITLTLQKNLADNAFSIVSFLRARLIRLAPSLLAVLITLLVAGFLAYAPDQYYELSKEELWAAAFVSNFYFLHNTGYFDIAARKLPLLHTWFISALVQIYVLYVVGVWLLRRVSRSFLVEPHWTRSALTGAMLVFLGGFIASGWVSPKLAYYLAPSRMWEFLAGAIVVTCKMQIGKRAIILRYVGIVLVFGALLYRDSGQFIDHAVRVILACAGTVCLIFGGNTERRPFSLPISSQPIRLLSQVSYSYYLWHWPILAIGRHMFAIAETSVWPRILLMLIAWAPAYVSHRYLERPLRNDELAPQRARVYVAVSAAAVLACAALVSFKEGALGEVAPQLAPIRSKQVMWEWACPHEGRVTIQGESFPRCTIGAPWNQAARHGILWGDSHAMHYAPLLDITASERSISLMIWNACPPFLDNAIVRIRWRDPLEVEAYNAGCARTREQGLAWIRANSEPVLIVIAQEWSSQPAQLFSDRFDPQSQVYGEELMLNGMRRFLAEIANSRNEIVLLGDVPTTTVDLADCYVRALTGKPTTPCPGGYESIDALEVAQSHGPTNNILKTLSREYANTFALIASERLCGEMSCPTMINGELIYRDGDHLRRNLREGTKRILIAKLALDQIFHARLPS